MSRDDFISLFQSRKLRPSIAERTSEMAVMFSLAANGYGYALANIRPQTERAPDGGKLRFISIEGDFRAMTLGLATMQSERTSRIPGAFQEHCRLNVDDRNIPGMASPI